MLNIVFEDPYLLVINKPPGMVVTRSETQKENTLEDILEKDFTINVERAGIVHRLDKDTSGLLIVAKTPEMLEKMQQQFKGRQVKKTYLALVHGQMEQGGVVDGAIGRNPGNREKFTVFKNETEGGKAAVTEYQPLQLLVMHPESIAKIFSGFNKIQMRKLNAIHYPLFTLVECHPLTGRTHQIRVHLKYLGFSIVADEKYGGRKVVRLDKRWCQRQFLHAAKLEFIHPVTGERLSFASRLPEDLQQALGYLENAK